jgi:hypothetical protein
LVSLIAGIMTLCATMVSGWEIALAAPASKNSRIKSAAKRTTTGPVKNEAQAVSIVSSRPEVKQFVANVKKSGRKGSSSHIEFDRKENGEFVIHVYEYVPDDEESGHTATMNWYHVNAKTGKVTTEF